MDIMQLSDNYDKKYKYDAQNRSQSLVLCYIWSESMFQNTAPPFAPPKNAPPPFNFHTSRIEILHFSTFLRLDPIFMEFQKPLPPLSAPPFFIFEKFKIFSTIFHFIIILQNALFWLYRPIPLKRISHPTMKSF